MKVAIDARLIAGTSTGDSTYWTCFLEAFTQLYPEVELICISNRSKPLGVPWLENISWLNVPAKTEQWWSMVTLPLAARKVGANLLHVQYALSPLAKNGISTVHDVSFMIEPAWFSVQDQTLLKMGVELASRKAKRIVTVSETSKSEILRFFPKAKVKTRVATNACPPWIQRASPEQVSRVLDSHGITGPYAFTVGTNWARKNMKLAVEATREAGCQLVVTGKQGGELAANHVRATGYVDTDVLSALYTSATLYLAPSLHEGFGIPIVEAMRCGTPVVCGPGGAMPEVAGTAGFVMPDYDTATWAKAVRKLLNDPSKLSELSMRGTEREAEFTWSRSAQAHYEVYREVVK
ncbi:MAG: glycosyltransferase family 4 protein [Armatimonadetes bacterium]|nr:glycosyltransferase family 4 protein [Armatimonadota bacterium]